MKKLGKAAPALVAVLMLALLAGACGGKGPDAAERAKKEILDALVLPPDAKLRDTQANPLQDMLVMSFGTKEQVDVIGEVFKKGVADRGYSLLSTADGMISYRDQGGRQITVMWFARDPDLSEFPTVFHVSIQPLPPELKDLAPAPKPAPAPAKPAAPASEVPAAPEAPAPEAPAAVPAEPAAPTAEGQGQ